MNRIVRSTVIVVAAVIAGSAGYYAWNVDRLSSPTPSPQVAQLQSPAPKSDGAPAKNYRIEAAPKSPVIPLPDLDESDMAVGDALARLLDGKSLPAFFYPNRMIRRFVATIDNLPRRHAPARMWPVKPVSKAFMVSASSTGLAIDQAANAARYAPYVDVMQAVAAPGLVDLYVRFYPLFQQAFQELGFPKGYFNSRLIETLDDLLAAPEVPAPVRLVQPKVLYEFVDSDLEGRSAGQKIMIRMGSGNEARAKLVLRAIRNEVMRRLSDK